MKSPSPQLPLNIGGEVRDIVVMMSPRHRRVVVLLLTIVSP
jgi:hypothetical protein